MKLIAGTGTILAIASLLQLSRIADEGPRVIGPIETIIEVHSNIPFLARVDTGATTCSMHFESLQIRNAAVDPQDNVGKRIRFLVKNRKGQSTWIESDIAGAPKVQTSEDAEQRYMVWLTLRCREVEKRVLVTLNDRTDMTYPLLIGRNFLRDDFVVDVGMVSKH
ncbi:MAG: RimK/LysX family protein [Pirellulales bacterium]